jgi:hypothetical protein
VYISAAGFSPYATSVTVKKSRITVERTLTLAARSESVDVPLDEQEERTDPRAGLAPTVLTEREIEQLPDDVDLMEEMLKTMAGPGAMIRVDGFRGGRLPHKSQIQSIRFRLTPYSAEEHDDGFMIIDVTTKPGLGEWHGNVGVAFGDDSLNARNAFAVRREPQQSRRIDFNLLGPVVKNKTSTSFHFNRNNGYDSRTSIGVMPEGPFSTLIRLPQSMTNGGVRAQHLLTRSWLTRGEYQYDRQERSSAMNFDLPERQWSTFNESHLVRFGAQGSFSERAVNELRAQTQWTRSGADSLTRAPAVIVQGAFQSGGANQDSLREGRSFEITDHFSFNRRKHGFRMGAEVETFSYHGRDFTNGYGVTTYPSLAAFEAGQAAVVSRRSADVAVKYRQTRVAAYFQDDMRVRKDLSLSLGLRVEGMTQIPDPVNAAPRVGFAWSPFRHGKTTLRGGAGIFNQWYEPGLYEETLRLNGASQLDLVTTPFGMRLPGFLRTATYALPYTLRASFGVQQQLPGRFNLVVDYRQQRGLHQFRSRNVNTPGSGLGYLLELETGARSRMHGLMVGFSAMPAPDAKGWRSRLFWSSHLMLSRTRDETSNPLTPVMDPLRARADYGPSAMDVRLRFGMMLQATMWKGFQVGTFWNASTAPPFNVTTGFDGNGDSFFNDRPAGVGRNSMRGEGQFSLGTRVAWSHGFGERKGDGGGAPVMVRMRMDGGAGIPDMPMGMGPSRTNPLVRVQLYVQAVNAFNHVNPVGFVGVATSPFFGRATGAMPPRRVEVGMRFSF